MSPWVLDDKGVEPQVFTSMRISPTREPLHKEARGMGRDNEEEEFDDNAAGAAYCKSIAKRLKAENGALREKVTPIEASALID